MTEYLTAEDAERLGAVLREAQAMQPRGGQQQFSAELDERLAFISRSVVPQPVGENDVKEPLSEVSIQFSYAQLDAVLNNLATAVDDDVLHAVDLWVVMMQNMTAMLHPAFRMPRAFFTVHKFDEGGQRSLEFSAFKNIRQVDTVHGLDKTIGLIISSTHYIIAEYVNDPLSPIGTPMSSMLYYLKRRPDDDIPPITQKIGEGYLRDYLTLFVGLTDTEADNAMLTHSIQALDSNQARLIIRADSEQERLALFLKWAQWLSEQHVMEPDSFPIEADYSAAGIWREVSTSLLVRVVISTDGSMLFSPWPKNASELAMRRPEAPRQIPSTILDLWESSIKTLKAPSQTTTSSPPSASASAAAATLVSIGEQPPLLKVAEAGSEAWLQNAAAFCIGRLFGAQQPYKTSPEKIAQTKLGLSVKDDSALIGSSETSRDQFSTVAGVMTLHRALWPRRCVFPSAPTDSFLLPTVLFIQGRHASNSIQITQQVQALFEAIMRHHGIAEARYELVTGLFYAIVDYLKLAQSYFTQINTIIQQQQPKLTVPETTRTNQPQQLDRFKNLLVIFKEAFGVVTFALPAATMKDQREFSEVRSEFIDKWLLSDEHTINIDEAPDGFYSPWHYTGVAFMIKEYDLIGGERQQQLGSVPWVDYWQTGRAGANKLKSTGMQFKKGETERTFSPDMGQTLAADRRFDVSNFYENQAFVKSFLTVFGEPADVDRSSGSTQGLVARLGRQVEYATQLRNKQFLSQPAAAAAPPQPTTQKQPVPSQPQRPARVKQFARRPVPPMPAQTKGAHPTETGVVVGVQLQFTRQQAAEKRDFMAYGKTEPQQTALLRLAVGSNTTLASFMDTPGAPENTTQNTIFLANIADMRVVEVVSMATAIMCLLDAVPTDETLPQAWLKPVADNHADFWTAKAELIRTLERLSNTPPANPSQLERAKQTLDLDMFEENNFFPRTTLCGWLKSLLYEVEVPEDSPLQRVYMRALVAMHKRLFGMDGEESRDSDQFGTLAFLPGVLWLVRNEINNTISDNGVGVQLKNQLETLLTLGDRAISVIYFIGTVNSRMARYQVRLMFAQMIRNCMQIGLSIRYAISMQSMVVNRLTTPPTSPSQLSWAGLEIGTSWLSMFQRLSLFAASPKLTTLLSFEAKANAGSLISRGSDASHYFSLFDASQTSTVGVDLEKAELLHKLWNTGTAALTSLLTLLLPHQGMVALDEAEANVLVYARQSIARQLGDRYKLTATEETLSIGAALSQVVDSEQSVRRARGEQISGVEVDQVIVGRMRSVLAQRCALFEALVEACITVAHGEQLEMFGAYFNALVHDASHSRLYWTGVGRTVPIVVTERVPYLEDRVAALKEQAQELEVIARAAETEAGRSQQAAQVLEESEATSAVLMSAVSIQSRSELIYHRQTLTHVLRDVTDREAALTAEISRLDESIISIREAGRTVNATVERRRNQAAIEVADATRLKNYLEGLQLMDVLDTDNRGTVINRLLRSTPKFEEKLVTWRRGWRELLAYLPSIEREIEASLFKAIARELTQLADQWARIPLPSSRTTIATTSAATEQLILGALQRITRQSVSSSTVKRQLSELPIGEESEVVVFFASQIAVPALRGMTLRDLLDAQTETFANLQIQLEFFQRDLPASEVAIVRDYLRYARNPLVSGITLPDSFNAAVGSIRAQLAASAQILVSDIDARRLTAQEAWTPQFFVLYQPGALEAATLSEPTRQAIQMLVKDSANDPRAEAFTVAVLEYITTSPAQQFETLMHATSELLLPTSPAAAAAASSASSRASASALQSIASSMTVGSRSPTLVHSLRAGQIRKSDAVEMLKLYRKAPRAYMNNLTTFHVITIAVNLNNHTFVRPIETQLMPLLRAYNSLLDVIRGAVESQTIIALEDSSTLLKQSLPMMVQSRVRTFAINLTDRLSEDARITVEAEPLDARHPEVIEDMYAQWRVNSVGSMPAHWPLVDPLVFCRAVSQKDFARTKDLKKITGDYAPYDAVVGAERSLNVIGALWLKYAQYAASEGAVEAHLHTGLGQPASMARLLAQYYSKSLCKASSQPLLETNQFSAVHGGVIHVDSYTTAVVLGSARFYDALHLQPDIVKETFKSHAQSYYERLRLFAIYDVVSQLQQSVEPGAMSWLAEVFSKQVQYGSDIKTLPNLQTFSDVVLENLFFYRNLVSRVKASITADSWASVTNNARFLDFIMKVIGPLVAGYDRRTALRKYDIEVLQTELSRRANEVLALEDRYGRYKQITPTADGRELAALPWERSELDASVALHSAVVRVLSLEAPLDYSRNDTTEHAVVRNAIRSIQVLMETSRLPPVVAAATSSSGTTPAPLPSTLASLTTPELLAGALLKYHPAL